MLCLLCVALQEEAIPELEIDVDELLDMQNDEDRAARVKVWRIASSGDVPLLLSSLSIGIACY